MNQSSIGQSIPRSDAAGKVTGRTLYPGDISRPDMLHMATLFAGRPHARVVSLDVTAAATAPGVVAIFTAADVPVNEYGLQIKDQPVLCGPGSGKAGADIVRFVGDQVALVVAETEAQARPALKLIRVEWEDLPCCWNRRRPCSPAPQLHPHCADNIAYSYRIRKGDLDAGFRGGCRSRGCLPDAGAGTPISSRRRAWHTSMRPAASPWRSRASGRMRTARRLPMRSTCRSIRSRHLPGHRRCVRGREDMSVQITLALAVWRLAQRGIHRPVKTIWTPRRVHHRHGKRAAMTIYTRWARATAR